MIDFFKKFCVYFSTALTFLAGIKTNFSIGLPWPILIIIALIVAIACASIAWTEVFPRTLASSRRFGSEAKEEGSLFFTVRKALEHVRFASRDDESIAYQANQIVRRCLDKHCIKYRDYREWRRKNPMVFTAIIDDENKLIGFFDILPLKVASAQELISGTLDEYGLTIDNILPVEENNQAKMIYIASIMLNPQQKTFSNIVAKEVILLKFAEFITSTFPPAEERMLFAYGHTAFGERLLRNAGFTNTLLPQDNKQHDPLYELPPDDYKELSKTFHTLVPTKRRLRYTRCRIREGTTYAPA